VTKPANCCGRCPDTMTLISAEEEQVVFAMRRALQRNPRALDKITNEAVDEAFVALERNDFNHPLLQQIGQSNCRLSDVLMLHWIKARRYRNQEKYRQIVANEERYGPIPA
jgi:hypothetical protein